MKLVDWSLAQSSSERFYSVTEKRKCRDPRPNIRWNSENPTEERKKDYNITGLWGPSPRSSSGFRLYTRGRKRNFFHSYLRLNKFSHTVFF